MEIEVQVLGRNVWGFEPVNDRDFSRRVFNNHINDNEITDFSCYNFAKFAHEQFSDNAFFDDEVKFPTGSNFDKSNLNSVNFNGAVFKEATFIESSLFNTTFNNSSFTDVDFRGANLSKTNFGSSKFIGDIKSNPSTEWDSANLAKIVLQDGGEILQEKEKSERLWQIVHTGKNWRTAVYSPEIRNYKGFCGEVRFPVLEASDYNSKEEKIIAYVKKLTLNSERDSENSERDSDRKIIDLSCYSFSRYSSSEDFNGFELSEFDFTDAKLNDSDFFVDANLTNAILLNAYLKNSDLTNAVLENAVLRGSDLTGTILKDTDLKCADLRGVEIDSSQLSEAKNVELAIWSPDKREELIEEDLIERETISNIEDIEANREETCSAVPE